ncbi:hypothetical protein [Methylobacterium sp. Gmos1]
MTVAALRRAGLVLRAWLALACAVLAPISAHALDAAQMPPLRGKSVETPTLMLGGGIVCTGATCDASGLSTLGPQTGAQAYSLSEQATDTVSVMAFIPKALRAGIRARTNTTDLTTYIQAALNTSKNVRFPSGDYQVCNALSQKGGQRLSGDGVTVSRLMIGPCFNMGAQAVVVATNSATSNGTPAEQSAGWDKIGVVFDQSHLAGASLPAKPTNPGDPNYATNLAAYNNAVASVRGNLRQYPWALDLNGSQRYTIGQIRLSNAWNGIKGLGTTTGPSASGFTADLLELGAFNRGIVLDGLYDFSHITTLHCWPWDVAQNGTLLNVATDGNSVCAEFGRIDGLDIKTANLYGSSLLGNANGTNGAARQIGLLQLDGDAAFFRNLAGDWHIGILSSTAGGVLGIPKVRWDGGEGLVANIRLWGGNSPQLAVYGGQFSAAGGSIQDLFDSVAVLAAGGTTMLNSIMFTTDPTQNAGTRNNPIVQQTAGLVHMVGSRWIRIPGNNVTLVQIQNDNQNHYIVANAFNGAALVKPSGSLTGTYAPN